jgi:hypothetical protein
MYETFPSTQKTEFSTLNQYVRIQLGVLGFRCQWEKRDHRHHHLFHQSPRIPLLAKGSTVDCHSPFRRPSYQVYLWVVTCRLYQ